MSLDQDVCDYVNKTHANAWRISTAGAPNEPAFVSSFLSKEMYRGLRHVLLSHASPGTKMMVRGIFTHQTPKVKLLTQSQAVEIADLMLVHQHFSYSRRHPTSGRALLFQAKKTPVQATGSVASGTQAYQFELYRDWSPFVGTVRLAATPAINSNAPWDFLQGGTVSLATATAGAEYLTVFDKQAYSINQATPQWSASLQNGPAHADLIREYTAACTWSAGVAPVPGSSASNGVSCPDNFGIVLAEFLYAQRGRSFTPGVLTGNDHWSIFVNTMLNISARPNGDYVYTCKNQGVIAGMRGRNLAFMQTLPALWHSIEEELDCLLSNGPGYHEAFDVTNALIKRIFDLRTPFHKAPPPETQEAPNVATPGHVPILIVTTIGNEFPFERG